MTTLYLSMFFLYAKLMYLYCKKVYIRLQGLYIHTFNTVQKHLHKCTESTYINYTSVQKKLFVSKLIIFETCPNSCHFFFQIF